MGPLFITFEMFSYPLWYSGRDAHWLRRPAEPHGNPGQRSVLKQRTEAAEGNQPWQGVFSLRTQRHFWLRDAGPRHPGDSCHEGALSVLFSFHFALRQSSSSRSTVSRHQCRHLHPSPNLSCPIHSCCNSERETSARNVPSWVNLSLHSIKKIISLSKYACVENSLALSYCLGERKHASSSGCSRLPLYKPTIVETLLKKIIHLSVSPLSGSRLGLVQHNCVCACLCRMARTFSRRPSPKQRPLLPQSNRSRLQSWKRRKLPRSPPSTAPWRPLASTQQVRGSTCSAPCGRHFRTTTGVVSWMGDVFLVHPLCEKGYSFYFEIPWCTHFHICIFFHLTLSWSSCVWPIIYKIKFSRKCPTLFLFYYWNWNWNVIIKS